MIELRWVERKRNLHPAVNVYNGHPTERVLQYRQLTIGAPIYKEGVLIGSVRKWSEWQDVPTVREE